MVTTAGIRTLPRYAVRPRVARPRGRRGPRWSARGRAGVVWGICCFLAIQGITAVFVDQAYPEIRDPNYVHRLTLLRLRLDAEPERPLLLALGSSRPETGLRPHAMALGRLPDSREPLAFNFAFHSSKPVDQLVTLRRLLADKVRPRWVLIELFPTALDHAPAGPDHILVKLSCRDVAAAAEYTADADHLWKGWAELAAVPVYTHRFCMLWRLAPSCLPQSCWKDHAWKLIDAAGWNGGLIGSMDAESRRRGLDWAHKQYEGRLDNCDTHPLVDRCLRELVRLCRAENMEPLFYVMPEGPEFQRMYAPAALKRTNNFFDRLSRATGVPIINARDWLPDEKYYVDSHHLLPPGAELFSERLGRGVRRLWLNPTAVPATRATPGAQSAE